MRILFIRHGITQGNKEKRYVGSRTDEGLCAEGRQQIVEARKRYLTYLDYAETKSSGKETSGTETPGAETLGAEVLRTESSCMVVASPLKRCLESAAMVFEDRKPRIEEDFREIDFGEFENKNYEELAENEHYKEWLASGGSLDFYGGEKRRDFIERNMQGFWRLLKRMEQEQTSTAVVFCHGGTMMSILSSLLKKPYFDFQVNNGEGYLLVIDKEGEEIVHISYHRI